MVALLVDHGADVDVAGWNDWTPLHAAAWVSILMVLFFLFIQEFFFFDEIDRYQYGMPERSSRRDRIINCSWE